MDARNSDVSFGEAVRVWWRVALLSFGGPAGQIAIMHTELVEKRRWIGEGRFLHALNFCMLLPGPEAQQLQLALRLSLQISRCQLDCARITRSLAALARFVRS